MMYLLLRDNKQSGPYSLDDLKVKGLKAYDLVWVEGRSAAWRYPSEIEELKAFSPAVEEQPFDRFFRKPAAVQHENIPAEAPAGTTAVTMTQPATATNPNSIRRTIYVTMPGGIAAREQVRETALAREVIRETSPIRETGHAREIVRDSTALRDSMPIREPAAYSREPLTEILPPLPRRKPSKIWIPLAVGSGVLVLLATGIFIGMSIHKEPASPTLASRPSGNNEQSIVRTAAEKLPVASLDSNKATNPALNAAGPAPDLKDDIPAEDKPVIRTRLAQHQKPDPARTQSSAAVTTSTDSPLVSLSPRREAVHRPDAVQTQPADDREGLKTTVTNEVSVGTNKYDVGTFGGIHNLQVTVTNHSAYSLDLVVVAVSYIQANKKTYKTENLYFRGIGPGSALMLEAPKSSRGITVQYKVTSINSRELGLSEPGT